LFRAGQDINLLSTEPADWASASIVGFSEYISGTLELGNLVISESSPFVHEILGSTLIIKAQSVVIGENVTVANNYKVIVNALKEINVQPCVQFTPQIQLRIKRDFYDTPVFEYADEATVSNFCSPNGAFQGDVGSRCLIDIIIEQQQTSVALEKVKRADKSTVYFHPNPTSAYLTFSATQPITSTEIYDLSGRMLLQEYFGDGGGRQVQLDLSAFSNGVYAVKATCGGEIFTERIVVSR